MIQSKKYSLNIRDVIHGFLISVGSGALTALLAILNDVASVPLQVNVIVKLTIIGGISGGTTYLLKKVFSNSEGKFKSEPKSDLQ